MRLYDMQEALKTGHASTVVVSASTKEKPSPVVLAQVQRAVAKIERRGKVKGAQVVLRLQPDEIAKLDSIRGTRSRQEEFRRLLLAAGVL